MQQINREDVDGNWSQIFSLPFCCPSLQDDEAGGEASELDLENVGGVFVVLVCGSFMACFITIFELLVNVRETAKKEKVGNWSYLRASLFA